MKQGKVFLCVPTFNEPGKVSLYLKALQHVQYPSLEVVIVNAQPGDETSRIIKTEAANVPYTLTELEGKREEFWSASLNHALVYVREKAAENDWVHITNIDIEFTDDIVTRLVNRATEIGNCQVGALALSNGVAISSGVIVKSWMLTLNRHPFAGYAKKDINATVQRVDFLPGRCFLFPARFLSIAGIIDAKNLPHYHADYEFSYRLGRKGCPPYIDTEINVIADMSNTGHSVYDNSSTMRSRFSKLWSIKNPAHPGYRVNMVMTMFPFYSVPTGLLLYLGRSVAEVLFGSKAAAVMAGKERGFSGSNLEQQS